MNPLSLSLLEACDPLHNKIVTGQGARLIKAAHVHFASEWNAEGLRAEHIWNKQQ